jgi:N-methylhydantoinase A
MVVDEAGCAGIATLLGELRDEALRWCEIEGIAPADRRLVATLDMRYVGQNFELPVPLAQTLEAGVRTPDARELSAAFFAVHERSYGYHNPRIRLRSSTCGSARAA